MVGEGWGGDAARRRVRHSSYPGLLFLYARWQAAKSHPPRDTVSSKDTYSASAFNETPFRQIECECIFFKSRNDQKVSLLPLTHSQRWPIPTEDFSFVQWRVEPTYTISFDNVRASHHDLVTKFRILGSCCS
jgi:hypothetical protein